MRAGLAQPRPRRIAKGGGSALRCGVRMLRCGDESAWRLTIIAHNGDYVGMMLRAIAAISTC
jgi:hypothetical protein